MYVDSNFGLSPNDYVAHLRVAGEWLCKGRNEAAMRHGSCDRMVYVSTKTWRIFHTTKCMTYAYDTDRKWYAHVAVLFGLLNHDEKIVVF